MKPDIKYINLKKQTLTKNPLNWKDDPVFPAHTVKTPGMTAYVELSAYETAVEALKKTACDKKSIKPDEAHLKKCFRCSALDALGEI